VLQPIFDENTQEQLPITKLKNGNWLSKLIIDQSFLNVNKEDDGLLSDDHELDSDTERKFFHGSVFHESLKKEKKP